MAMAASSQTQAPLSCLLDASFDLDEALSLPTNFGYQVRASNSSVADMPTVPAAGDVCVVCLETFQPENLGKRSPCGHVYHADCISCWLSHSNSCPLCRYNISGDR